MIVIPALDLYQGDVVRLTKGDPSRLKVYSDNPLVIAKQWALQGAKLLHLVDLSAALDQGQNTVSIKKILKEVKIKIQIGGGIRDIAKAKELIALGADWVIIGTKALDEDFLNSLIRDLGSEKIAAGVDMIGSFLAVEGWRKKTDFDGFDFIAYLSLKGIKRIIYTDVIRDGTMRGVNLAQVRRLKSFKDLEIILSGGVSSLDDLKQIKQEIPFIWGVIVGKALYEGKFSFSQASKVFQPGL